MTTQDLADKLAPRIKEYLQENEDSFIKEGKNILERNVIRLAFPSFVDHVPSLTKALIGFVSDEFGSMNVNDLLSFLSEHAKSQIYNRNIQNECLKSQSGD